MPERPEEVPDEQVTGLLTGVALLRLAVLIWALVVVAVDLRGDTELHAGLALGTLGVLGAWTSVVTQRTVTRAWNRSAPWLVAVDVALAAAVAAMDHLVYDGPHPQTFGSAWPLGAVVTAGVLRGATAGGLAGALVGTAGALGVAAFRTGGLEGQWLASAGTIVLLVVAGVLAGVVTDALRRAAMTAARARAREEFARDLHDGVLQTLAVVQRRSSDGELSAMARDQELALRRFIGDRRVTGSGADPGPLTADPTADSRSSDSRSADAPTVLRELAAEHERRGGPHCEVVVVDPLDWLAPAQVVALRGAVGEALTNAHRHGAASRVVVCLDEAPEGGALCTVVDDGAGFDPDRTGEGVGTSRSIRGRIEELGGSVRIDSSPGKGCEVELRLPSSARSRRS